MRRTEQRQGLRMLKLRDVLSRWDAGSLSQLECAELLGMSERTFRRGTTRVEAEGEDELSVALGEEVTVHAEVEGWVQVTRARDGVRGLVPASYVGAART